eukprot:gene14790-17484_t
MSSHNLSEDITFFDSQQVIDPQMLSLRNDFDTTDASSTAVLSSQQSYPRIVNNGFNLHRIDYPQHQGTIGNSTSTSASYNPYYNQQDMNATLPQNAIQDHSANEEEGVSEGEGVSDEEDVKPKKSKRGCKRGSVVKKNAKEEVKKQKTASGTRKTYARRNTVAAHEQPIGQHMPNNITLTAKSQYPSFFVQNGNIRRIELQATGKFTNRMSRAGTHQNLLCIAIPKSTECFNLSNNIANCSSKGEIIFPGISGNRLAESRELVIRFILYDKSSGILHELASIESDMIECFNNTKDIPPPTIRNMTIVNMLADGLVEVCAEADRLKWGISNLLTFTIVDQQKIVQQVVYQNNMKPGQLTKVMAKFDIGAKFLDGRHTLFTSYTSYSSKEKDPVKEKEKTHAHLKSLETKMLHKVYQSMSTYTEFKIPKLI